ncbi:MAG TPA: hypothetical protein VNQ99_04530 [Xanthobacteraceae bacterium]|nr:hypothetical protein [Xanthobacteraceae bacterium]
MTEHSGSRSAEALRREARLAAALRENLKRRKAQARARSQPATDPVSSAAAKPEENGAGTGVSPQSDGE